MSGENKLSFFVSRHFSTLVRHDEHYFHPFHMIFSHFRFPLCVHFVLTVRTHRNKERNPWCTKHELCSMISMLCFISYFHLFPCAFVILCKKLFFWNCLYVSFLFTLQKSYCRKWRSNGCAFTDGHYCLLLATRYSCACEFSIVSLNTIQLLQLRLWWNSMYIGHPNDYNLLHHEESPCWYWVSWFCQSTSSIKYFYFLCAQRHCWLMNFWGDTFTFMLREEKKGRKLQMSKSVRSSYVARENTIERLDKRK